MTWWLTQNRRLSSEKAVIADLEASVDWLRVHKWHANADLAMCVDFLVVNGDKEFGFQMIYPSVFPDAPPMIYTEDKSRISRHQYGADGELCLEYRPDNWQPSITGADMIASCQRLLSEERPDNDQILHAHSAHVASLGRDMRSKYFRLLVTENDINALNVLPECEPTSIGLRERLVTSICVSTLSRLGLKDEPIWASDLVLPKEGAEQTGFAVRVAGTDGFGEMKLDELRTFLEGLDFIELSKSLLDADSFEYLLVGDDGNWTLFCIYGEAQDRKVICYTTLQIPSEKQRLPDSFETLEDKKVGIVGCGSVGSKIAASLCRSGIGNFFLIDEDIFFPGNVVRNELDLNDIGAHKAHALRDRLLKINPKADIKALRIGIGGQESASSMVGALESLGECDLLIDATAEPTAFNMIASVSTRRRKPMIWVEVFAGGIGGIVARARPDIDPVPLSARAQIEAWCNDQDVDWIRPVDVDRYDGRDDDGTPLIAEDAEISIMAAHATRFASDILARPEASIFPRSAYIIGFSSDWLFTEPFDTRPIDLQQNGEWGETVDTLDPAAVIQLLKEHLPSKEDADATAAPK
ncbi:MAG: ThiF family adenylyltransferase [Gammaproteobacteria bacterium]|nr:ThiF family adenylyltransferase [Gammaproteobacteria bacterium]